MTALREFPAIQRANSSIEWPARSVSNMLAPHGVGNRGYGSGQDRHSNRFQRSGTTDRKELKRLKEREMVRKTKKSCLPAIAALLFVLTWSPIQSGAGVNVYVGDGEVNVDLGGEGVNVNIGNNLPAISFAAPPDLVVIPGTYVYMVPDIDVDVLFYQGDWWRPYQGRWYRSRDYDGQWSYVEAERIPSGLRALPQDYRHRLSTGYERIPHGDVKRNWRHWEKVKHWDSRVEHERGEHGDHDHGSQGGHDR